MDEARGATLAEAAVDRETGAENAKETAVVAAPTGADTTAETHVVAALVVVATLSTQEAVPEGPVHARVIVADPNRGAAASPCGLAHLPFGTSEFIARQSWNHFLTSNGPWRVRCSVAGFLACASRLSV